MKYRTRQRIIEARQLTEENLREIKGWINGDDGPGSSHPAYLGYGDISVRIRTPEGSPDMRADVGDWIIRGEKGDFHICRPDIFEATYEPT